MGTGPAARGYKHFMPVMSRVAIRNELEGHRPRCPRVQTFHACDVAGSDTGTEAGAHGDSTAPQAAHLLLTTERISLRRLSVIGR